MTWCRTPEDAYRAGWADGRSAPPLTPAQRSRIAALLAPYVAPVLREQALLSDSRESA